MHVTCDDIMCSLFDLCQDAFHKPNHHGFESIHIISIQATQQQRKSVGVRCITHALLHPHCLSHASASHANTLLFVLALSFCSLVVVWVSQIMNVRRHYKNLATCTYVQNAYTGSASTAILAFMRGPQRSSCPATPTQGCSCAYNESGTC